MILTADFPVYLAGLTDFDCGLFCSPNLDILNLNTDIWIWNGAHGGCDRSAGDTHSSAAPDPTFAFVEGPCCPTLDLYLLLGLWLRFTQYQLRYFILCLQMGNIGSIYDKLESYSSHFVQLIMTILNNLDNKVYDSQYCLKKIFMSRVKKKLITSVE
jgi:hypothetical protein